jgi:NADH dehydrogenase
MVRTSPRDFSAGGGLFLISGRVPWSLHDKATGKGKTIFKDMKDKHYIANIPESDLPRLVVIGGGFAGLRFIRKMRRKAVQIVLLDKNNFHQFQPLLYQVATAGLEPSAISFPLRKILQKEKNIHFRIAEVREVIHDSMEIRTNIGYLKYDQLVLATGAETNYFGNREIQHHALSMKSAADAIYIRNTILENFEAALLEDDPAKAAPYLNIVLVGGGPTGVELAGALAEMKKYIFPKDYPELDISKMRIVLFEAGQHLLSGMSLNSSETSHKYLKNLGVEVRLNTSVIRYDGTDLELSDGTKLKSKTVIWAAGIKTQGLQGIPNDAVDPKGRFKVDRMNRIFGLENVYAVGDNAIMKTPRFPEGHPQVAQVAIQQASNLVSNISRMMDGESKPLKPFEYKDRGSMATVGRNLAVADLPGLKIKGMVAWLLWSFVHLFTIFGLKNRIMTFINWTWHYLTYDQSLRLLIRPKPERQRLLDPALPDEKNKIDEPVVSETYS